MVLFPGRAAVFAESFRGAPITVRLNQDVDHVATDIVIGS